ncbi:ScbA/BarX family gamma-butyrolactone biosynthesis protein [Trabulsiella odontotermitis]|uniref:ScbA/BarX family gamma-butyrolactone biosynthesis protein n=1 Tax=Trabulsiella odontotermitis TaxID=379893 RepID=UPI0024B70D2E|nr:ScbA/BarX family gamma-butyrolactone biosynthesis protein [Trabulsiella odontotermitis]WHP32468.1 ScbA/BarX family gamma-butyrolactone biosynthesis protein [Trabulsiella odontotermitis]
MSFIEDVESEFIIRTGSYNYQNTIPKSCVHRAAVGEVFLTDIRKIHDNKYITAGYLPKSHIYFNDLPFRKSSERVYDAILLLEICRQTSIYVTHNFFAVPYSAKFVFDDADFTLFESEIPYKTECSNVIVEVDIIERKFRKSELTGLIFRMDIYVDGLCCAQKIMNISWMDDKKWHRLRSQRPLENHDYSAVVPAEMLEVGRQLPLNVVVGNADISEPGITTTVIVDQSHPSIFDHPLDHVPGMLLMEAYRQTALLAMRSRLGTRCYDLVISRYNVNFTRFCEFNSPAYCHALLGEIYLTEDKKSTVIPMTISQDEKTVSTAELTITFK